MELQSDPLYTDANLLAYYRLEDTSASVGGATRNLTNTNSVAFTSGAVYANGANFGAANSNQYLSTSGFNAGTGSLSTAMSFVGRYKMNTEIGAGSQSIMYLGVNGAPNIAYEIRYEYNGGTRRLAFNRRRENIANNYQYVYWTLGTAKWWHIAWTWDNSNYHVYINGQWIQNFVVTGGTGNAGSEQSEFRLGRNRNADNLYASLQCDDVAVFDRVLTRDEIGNLYKDAASPIYQNQYRRTRELRYVSRP